MAQSATEPPFRRLGPSGCDPYRAASRSLTASSWTTASAAPAERPKGRRVADPPRGRVSIRNWWSVGSSAWPASRARRTDAMPLGPRAW